MKRIFRPMFAFLFLLAFTLPQFAQNPNVAIRLDAGKFCVKGTLKNLRTTTIGVTYIELWVFEAKTCKRVCVGRKVINKKIKPCDTMDFDLCCSHPPPAVVDGIYYFRVHHSAGINEAWAFAT